VACWNSPSFKWNEPYPRSGGERDLMYVGLDVHKRVCYSTVKDEKGKVVKQVKFINAPKGLEEFMEDVDMALVAMEAGYARATKQMAKPWNVSNIRIDFARVY